MGIFSLYLAGCGSSQPTHEDEAVTDTWSNDESTSSDSTTDEQATVDEQTANTDTTEEQTAKEPQTQTVETQQPVDTIAQGPSVEELQQELDALKSENLQMQDRLSQTSNENKSLSTKVSDLEAALAAAKSARKEPSSKVISRTASAGKSSPAQIQKYTDAVNTTKQRNYSEAIHQFESLLNSGIKDDYADNCYYWIGESYFQLKKYKEAIDHFKQVANYKFSEKKDDAQFMIARSYERLGQREKANDEYRKLVELYPASELASKAQAKIR